jgi:hypothetical protein
VLLFGAWKECTLSRRGFAYHMAMPEPYRKKDQLDDLASYSAQRSCRLNLKTEDRVKVNLEVCRSKV